MVRTQKGSVVYIYTKFEADSLNRSKVIRSQNFEIGSRDLSVKIGLWAWTVRALKEPKKRSRVNIFDAHFAHTGKRNPLRDRD